MHINKLTQLLKRSRYVLDFTRNSYNKTYCCCRHLTSQSCINTNNNYNNSNNNNSVLDYLLNRGLVSNTTNTHDLHTYLQQPRTIYLGIDPTADSLHIGHLLGIRVLNKLQQAGHNVILVVGGATASIGDPSGRSTERNVMSYEQIQHNINSVKPQLQKLLHINSNNNNSNNNNNNTSTLTILNNYDWFSNMNVLTYLSDIGRYFRVNGMLSKDSVKQRLHSSNHSGMSYTEFSYQCMQGYDFYYLYKNYNCSIQIGGSDQWGNITAGIQLIHKLVDNTDIHVNSNNNDINNNDRNNNTHTHRHLAYGITTPLLTTPTGEKFGM